MSGPETGVFVVGTVAIAAIALTWMKLHYGSQKTVKSGDLAAIESRLAKIEQAVDAIAVEAERISEGQRFTTKLLSDRSPVRSEQR
jgi:glucosamine 6-phosphate synthetase-like amidotransferase/phosphosugar isomerase protein